jgi:hypothetical protein
LNPQPARSNRLKRSHSECVSQIPCQQGIFEKYGNCARDVHSGQAAALQEEITIKRLIFFKTAS